MASHQTTGRRLQAWESGKIQPEFTWFPRLNSFDHRLFRPPARRPLPSWSVGGVCSDQYGCFLEAYQLFGSEAEAFVAYASLHRAVASFSINHRPTRCVHRLKKGSWYSKTDTRGT